MTVTIDPGQFAGLYDVQNDGNFVSGVQTVDVEPGWHYIRPGTQFNFHVDASGLVTLGPGYDGVSATGGMNQLTVLTVPVTIDPGDYQGHWSIGNGRTRPHAPGFETVHLVPTEGTNFDGSIGGQYSLSIGVATSAIRLNLRAGGVVTASDSSTHASADALSISGSTITFKNVEVTVTDRNQSGIVWIVRQVAPEWPTWHTGDLTFTVVPHVNYLFQTNIGISEWFWVHEPCATSVTEVDANGSFFDIGCGPSSVDQDADGIPDDVDNCPDIANADQTDNDLDGAGDVCDADDDNDGVGDGVDNCPLVSNADQADLDGDGLGDVCDSDLDGDGFLNEVDNCPAAANADQTDTDGDGQGDECDSNDDGDAFEDASDNCPTVPNDDQADLDGDLIGDVCDVDVDGDGICEGGEAVGGVCSASNDNCPLASNPDQNDSDGDGLGDACDADDDNDGVDDTTDNCPFLSNTAQHDFDGDGIGDACDSDLDGDGVGNAFDNCPSAPNSEQSDLDGDGLGDACDDDTDGDGVANATDVCAGTPAGKVVDPGNGCSIAQLCPCEGPRGTNRAWRNHGKYVSCTARAANDFLGAQLIDQATKEDIVSTAGQSSCGSH